MKEKQPHQNSEDNHDLGRCPHCEVKRFLPKKITVIRAMDISLVVAIVGSCITSRLPDLGQYISFAGFSLYGCVRFFYWREFYNEKNHDWDRCPHCGVRHLLPKKITVIRAMDVSLVVAIVGSCITLRLPDLGQYISFAGFSLYGCARLFYWENFPTRRSREFK